MKFIAFVIVSVYIYGAIRVWISNKQEQEDAPFFDSARLIREIEKLYKCAKQLESLDNALIDIRLCSPEEAQRVFKMQWQSVSGNNCEYDLFVDGEDETSYFMEELTVREREKLNEEIQQRIVTLYKTAAAMSASENDW